MAANKTQGNWLTLFMLGLTTACAGLAYVTTGMGKMSLGLGVVVLAVSCWKFFTIKSLEGKIALKSQPAALKLGGVAINLAGWLITVFAIKLTPSVGGRMVGALLGLAITLVGVVIILPMACNKNAIWKA